MVGKILKVLNMEINGLHQAAYLLGFFAILSQIMALARDRLLAHFFGAGLTLDIYYAAFKIPDLIFVTVASLVSISVLIPFLSEKINEPIPEQRKFIDTVFSFFFIIIIISSIAVFFAAPYLVKIFFNSFDGDSQRTLIILTRIILISPIFLGISNLFGSITQTYKRFFLYASSPIFYNAGIIFGIIFLRPTYGIVGVAVGVVIGAFLHMAIQVPFVFKKGLFPRFKLFVDRSIISRVALISIPRTIALAVTHIVGFVLVIMASKMTLGSITVFSFSLNLQSVPLSIVGVSYSLAAFPTLSRLFSGGEMDKFISQITESAKHIIFWSIPASVLFVVLRAQIVRVVFGSGEFDWSDTRLTAAALAIFAMSVVFQGLVLLFVRGFYSMGNTKKPLFINIISGAVMIGLTFFLGRFFESNDLFRFFIEDLFKVGGLSGTEVLMLPLAYSLGFIFNGILLWIFFRINFKKSFSRPIIRSILQSLSASVLMGLTTYRALDLFDEIFNLSTLFGIFMQGLSAGLVGIAVWVFVLVAIKNMEIRKVWKTLHRKIWGSEVISQDQGLL